MSNLNHAQTDDPYDSSFKTQGLRKHENKNRGEECQTNKKIFEDVNEVPNDLQNTEPLDLDYSIDRYN